MMNYRYDYGKNPEADTYAGAVSPYGDPYREIYTDWLEMSVAERQEIIEQDKEEHEAELALERQRESQAEAEFQHLAEGFQVGMRFICQ